MGKGKGSVNDWVFKTFPGFLLCEIQMLRIKSGIKILTRVQKRLSIKTKVIYNINNYGF